MSVEEVKKAVNKELDGPGKLLGYRAMCHKVRQDHKLNVPRDLVHAVMYELEPKRSGSTWTSWQKEDQTKGKFYYQRN